TACLEAAALVALGALEGRAPAQGSGGWPGWRAIALGPFLFLQLQFLQNAGFVASDVGLGLAAATALLLVADAVAILVGSSRLLPAESSAARTALAVGALGAVA